MTELLTDAIKQLFVMTDCDCEEECYCDNNHTIIKLAIAQLQALLDDRDKWRNRSLAIEECLQDFDNQWQHARDYPSKHNDILVDKQ